MPLVYTIYLYFSSYNITYVCIANTATVNSDKIINFHFIIIAKELNICINHKNREKREEKPSHTNQHIKQRFESLKS